MSRTCTTTARQNSRMGQVKVLTSTDGNNYFLEKVQTSKKPRQDWFPPPPPSGSDLDAELRKCLVHPLVGCGIAGSAMHREL